MSWWVWLSFERFLAGPGAGFRYWVEFPGPLHDAKQHMDTRLGIQRSFCTKALFLLDVNT